jgi:hypothetical protein
MKKLLAIPALVLLSGCQMVYLKDKSVQKDGTSHVVTAVESSLISNQKLQDLDVDYNGVKIKVQNWSTKGDAEFVKALGNAIINGILAWGTMGTSEAIRAAVEASLAAKASASTNCVDNCAPAK